jgi:SAM-dependent methyltransferase
MENNSGLRKVLYYQPIYSFFQNLVGADKVRKWLVNYVMKIKNEETVVDLGCGPGDILKHLPNSIKYIGIDINESYITKAKNRFEHKGNFFLGDALNLLTDKKDEIGEADLVLSIGFLHHLKDEQVLLLLKSIKELLKEGGRCIFLEPTFLLNQNNLSKWIMKMDRGKNIRLETDWKSLIGKVFPNSSTSIVQGLILIPYVHILVECFNNKKEGSKL